MGKSNSDASTKTTTKYDTTTSTTIGDIGFTGKDAIAFQTALLQYNLASQQQAFNAVNGMRAAPSSYSQSGADGPTENAEGLSDEKKPGMNPALLIGGVLIAAVAGYFLFIR